jgi:hypothetical protein
MANPVTTAAITPRKVEPADLPELCKTLTGAFYDDPVFTWWIADGARRRDILPEFFRVVTEANLAFDELYATDELMSGAVWNPPDVEDDEEMIPALAEIAGEYTDALFKVFELMAEKHPTESHWYLFFLGTRPGWQSRGLGSAIGRGWFADARRSLLVASASSGQSLMRRFALFAGARCRSAARRSPRRAGWALGCLVGAGD